MEKLGNTTTIERVKPSDPTEESRRIRITQINEEPGSREALESQFGRVWDTTELQRDFVVTGFLAPFVAVRRRDDDDEGTLEFQHSPRFYFNFQSHNR